MKFLKDVWSLTRKIRFDTLDSRFNGHHEKRWQKGGGEVFI